MEQWTLAERWRYGAVRAAGLGWLAGAAEAVALSASSSLPLGLISFLALAAMAVVSMGLVAGVVGAVAGLVHVLFKNSAAYRNVAAQLALTAGVLAGWYLWPLASQVWEEGRPLPAVAMALMPFGAVGVAYLNARYWTVRVELAREIPVGWLRAAAGGAVALSVLAAGLYAKRDTGGAHGLDDDPNVLLITVDGLAAADVTATNTPRLARMMSEAGSFSQAVTPAPASAPGHATLLTGLHPLRHRVVDDAASLSRGFRSVAEILRDEGYSTAAFVSTWTVGGRSGLGQGFLTFDDDVLEGVPGTADVSAGRAAIALLAAARLVPRSWSVRDAAATVDRFDAWWASHAHVPHFAWVQLADTLPPHGNDPAIDDALTVAGGPAGEEWAQVERLRQEDMARVDDAVGRILDGLQTHGIADTTLVIVTSTRGTPAGARGPGHAPAGLWDELIRVPLIMALPGGVGAGVSVPEQVRLMDVLPSILSVVGIDPIGSAEGIDLTRYLGGARAVSVWCSLLGRDREGGWLLGYRNDGVKYTRRADGSEEALYDVDVDAAEQVDVSEQQEGAIEQLRGLLRSEGKALDAILARPALVAPGTQRRLEQVAGG